MTSFWRCWTSGRRACGSTRSSRQRRCYAKGARRQRLPVPRRCWTGTGSRGAATRSRVSSRQSSCGREKRTRPIAVSGCPLPLATPGLPWWRDLVRRYPDRDARSLLEDLIALHGRKGKWFAAAKTAGYLDIALHCAADREAARGTLIRAARDFEVKNPAFAAQVALHAIAHLRAGVGYEPSPLDIDVAVDHLMAASERIGRTAWAIDELKAAGAPGRQGRSDGQTPQHEARRSRGEFEHHVRRRVRPALSRRSAEVNAA